MYRTIPLARGVPLAIVLICQPSATVRRPPIIFTAVLRQLLSTARPTETKQSPSRKTAVEGELSNMGASDQSRQSPWIWLRIPLPLIRYGAVMGLVSTTGCHFQGELCLMPSKNMSVAGIRCNPPRADRGPLRIYLTGRKALHGVNVQWFQQIHVAGCKTSCYTNTLSLRTMAESCHVDTLVVIKRTFFSPMCLS